MKVSSDAAALVKGIALACGASAAGIACASELEEFGRYSAVVAAAPQGLAYLSREILKRKNIKNWWPDANCVLVCAFRYWTPGGDYAAALAGAGEPAAYLRSTGRRLYQPELAGPGAKIARYALGRDYHAAVKEKLDAALTGIKNKFPGAEGKSFCDTSPVMEKELARLAGLGARGRHTLIVSRELGSYFFIGGLALNLELGADAPAADSCAGCDLCVKACPTGALSGGVLDAGRCISYWTTQAKEKMPAAIAAGSGGFAYGCDLCQEACPLNK